MLFKQSVGNSVYFQYINIIYRFKEIDISLKPLCYAPILAFSAKDNESRESLLHFDIFVEAKQ